MMIGLAIAMFIGLFGWGANYFGWDDPAGKVQLALATSFILGIVWRIQDQRLNAAAWRTGSSR